MLKTYGDLHVIDGDYGLRVELTGSVFCGEAQVAILAKHERYMAGAYVYVCVKDVAQAMEW